MANVLGLIATVLIAIATIFFLVGVATPYRGWFDLDGVSCQLGTVGACCFSRFDCRAYDRSSDNMEKLKNGGGAAIAFSVFAFLVGLVAIAWNLCTALGVGPGILQNGLIAAVLDGVAAFLSFIAWVVFVAVVKSLPDNFVFIIGVRVYAFSGFFKDKLRSRYSNESSPHYSWVLSLIGTVMAVIAAILIFMGRGGATAK